MPLFVAEAQLVDQRPDRLQNGIERVAVAGENHPGGQGAGAFAAEGIESLIDDFANVGLATALALDSRRNSRSDALGDRPRESRLKAGSGPEMVKQVGMGAAHGRRYRFE